jgi:hypothetical protein
MISQVHRYMEESLGINFSPGILAFHWKQRNLLELSTLPFLKCKSQLETVLLVHPLYSPLKIFQRSEASL